MQLKETTIKEIIRKKLNFNGSRLRFNMSGYDGRDTGDCTIYNLSILNTFAEFGIYDYTTYLFVDFYKGIGTLYLQYFESGEELKVDLNCMTTTEIIYKVFEMTILSNRKTRRRN